MTTRTTMAAGAVTLALLATGTACTSSSPRTSAAVSSPSATTAAPSAPPVSAPASPTQALPSPDPSDYLLSIRMTAKLPGSDAGQLSEGSVSDDKLLEIGRHVCAELRGHAQPAQVEKELEGSWARSNALVLLGAASGQFSSLCPDQHVAVQAYVQSLM